MVIIIVRFIPWPPVGEPKYRVSARSSTGPGGRQIDTVTYRTDMQGVLRPLYIHTGVVTTPIYGPGRRQVTHVVSCLVAERGVRALLLRLPGPESSIEDKIKNR